MSSDLMPFTYEGATVRTVIIDGEPWFVLVDLCAVLDIQNAGNVAARLDPSDVRQADVRSGGQMRLMRIVNESGMYEVVIRSDKSGAVAFRRWLTAEVLPTIRKTGGYGATPVPEIPADYPAALEEAARQARRAIAAESRIAELEPKAEVAARLLDAEGDLSVRDAAQSLTRAGIKTGQQRLFTELARHSWISRASDGRWRVLQYAIDHGFMSVIPQSHYHPKSGELVLDPPQPRVTPKGLQRLLTDFTKAGAA